MTEFSFLQSLPSIIFILAFFVVFVLFLFGGFVLLFARIDIQRIERGRRILLNSLYALFITLLVALAFFLVSYLLQRGEVLKPSEISAEFPPSPFTSFPSSPEFIKIGDYYFSGPLSLESLEQAEISISPEFFALYAILCKKNGEYDIIYIGGVGERGAEHECWLENCNQKTENLYLAIFLTSSDPEEIKDKITGQVNPPCPLVE